VRTGRVEPDPKAAMEALWNNEFVHMSDVEAILIQHGNDVADAVADQTPAERMRSAELREESSHSRWKGLFDCATSMTKRAGGKIGFTIFILSMITRSLRHINDVYCPSGPDIIDDTDGDAPETCEAATAHEQTVRGEEDVVAIDEQVGFHTLAEAQDALNPPAVL